MATADCMSSSVAATIDHRCVAEACVQDCSCCLIARFTVHRYATLAMPTDT
jgi:hypothetical protein